MANARISLDQEALAHFCRSNHIRKLALFGSILRDDFEPDSDVDMLVEFAPDSHVSLVGICRMERQLAELIGRPVDLLTQEDLSPHIRHDILASAEVQYAE